MKREKLVMMFIVLMMTVWIRVVKGVDPTLDKEALRIVNLMPKWNPGQQNGITVRGKYIIPITFRLK